MICKQVLLIAFLDESKLIFSIQLNDSKHCYVSLTIQSNISHLLTLTEMIKLFYFKQVNLA